MPLPSGHVSHFMEQRRQEREGVEVVVDGDSMTTDAPMGRSMIPELRTPWANDPHFHWMATEEFTDVAGKACRQPQRYRRINLGIRYREGTAHGRFRKPGKNTDPRKVWPSR